MVRPMTTPTGEVIHCRRRLLRPPSASAQLVKQGNVLKNFWRTPDSSYPIANPTGNRAPKELNETVNFVSADTDIAKGLFLNACFQNA